MGVGGGIKMLTAAQHKHLFDWMSMLRPTRRRTSGCGCVTESQNGVSLAETRSTLAQAFWRMQPCLTPSCPGQLLSPLKTSPPSPTSALASRKWRVSACRIYLLACRIFILDIKYLAQSFVWKSRVTSGVLSENGGWIQTCAVLLSEKWEPVWLCYGFLLVFDSIGMETNTLKVQESAIYYDKTQHADFWG